MKNSTPLPRTRSVIALLFFLSISIPNVFAQNVADRTAIKEWIVANKEKLTLVSKKEYQAMSPAVKAIMDADAKVLIYDVEVTATNITAFENRNVGQNLVAFKFKTEREKANESEAEARTTKEHQIAELQAIKDQKETEAITQEQQNAALQITKERQERVVMWLEDNKHRNIKIISYQDYMSRTEADRNEMLKSGVLVYEGSELTMADIERFNQGQILPNK